MEEVLSTLLQDIKNYEDDTDRMNRYLDPNSDYTRLADLNDGKKRARFFAEKWIRPATRNVLALDLADIKFAPRFWEVWERADAETHYTHFGTATRASFARVKRRIYVLDDRRPLPVAGRDLKYMLSFLSQEISEVNVGLVCRKHAEVAAGEQSLTMDGEFILCDVDELLEGGDIGDRTGGYHVGLRSVPYLTTEEQQASKGRATAPPPPSEPEESDLDYRMLASEGQMKVNLQLFNRLWTLDKCLKLAPLRGEDANMSEDRILDELRRSGWILSGDIQDDG